MRIGLLGCGKVSHEHLSAMTACSDLELVAVCDPDAARARAAADEFGVHHACTHTDEFYGAGLDAVAVTSPAPAHLENVREAASHKVAVLCEKPLAMDEDDSREIMRIMHQAGLPLYTGFCYRFSPVAQQIKSLAEVHAIGDIMSLRLIFIWNLHGKYEVVDGERVVAARRHGRMLEGGPMVDCGTHQIDLSRWWLQSEVISFSGHGAWLEDYEAPDQIGRAHV